MARSAARCRFRPGDLLRRLEVVDETGKITGMGKVMVKLPLHPRLAHMVVRS